MQLIARLRIIYASLQSRVGLFEYQLSLPLHSAYCDIQTRHGERGKVRSSDTFAAAARSGSVLCVALAARWGREELAAL